MWIKPRLNVIKQTSKQRAKILVCKDTFKKDSKNTKPSFREESFSDVCFLFIYFFFFASAKKIRHKMGFSQFASPKCKFKSAKWFLFFIFYCRIYFIYLQKKYDSAVSMLSHKQNTFLSLCNTYDLFPAKTSSFIFGRKLEDRRSLSRRTKIL